MDLANVNRLKRTKRLGKFLERYEEVEELPKLLVRVRECLEGIPEEFEIVNLPGKCGESGLPRGNGIPEESGLPREAKASKEFRSAAGKGEDKILKTSYQEKSPSPYSSGQELVLCLPPSGLPYSGFPWTGMTGIGMAGTALLIESERDRLHKQGIAYHVMNQADGLYEASLRYPDLCNLREGDYTGVFPVLEGGILRTLYELSMETGLGLRVLYEAVPIKQITVEICECFDLNPWQLLSGGCLLFITDQGAALKRKLEALGFNGHRIGYLTEDKKKLICHSYDLNEEEGSCLNRPAPDEILKILVNDLV